MRDPNGRFAKANNHLESESVSVFDCEPLKRVIDAWNAQRFEFKLAKSWQVTESLYENASPEQKREFYAHLESHAIELVDANQTRC